MLELTLYLLVLELVVDDALAGANGWLLSSSGRLGDNFSLLDCVDLCEGVGLLEVLKS